MSGPQRVDTGGGEPLGHNPFAGLGGLSLPGADRPRPAPEPGATKPPAAAVPVKNRGRVDVLREKAGRGGKTVTVVTGFVGIGLPEKEELAKRMQKACGAGGTVKEGRIEIQGDKRDVVVRILAEAGFRAVLAGG